MSSIRKTMHVLVDEGLKKAAIPEAAKKEKKKKGMTST